MRDLQVGDAERVAVAPNVQATGPGGEIGDEGGGEGASVRNDRREGRCRRRLAAARRTAGSAGERSGRRRGAPRADATASVHSDDDVDDIGRGDVEARELRHLARDVGRGLKGPSGRCRERAEAHEVTPRGRRGLRPRPLGGDVGR
ncbi:MAG: hypothetical protein R2692_03825 [Microbacterium sp.]